MDFTAFKTSIFSVTNKYDPYRESTLLHLKNWCNAFFILFGTDGIERLPFCFDILSQLNVWQKDDTIHRIKLNRRNVAQQMVQVRSPSGMPTPLNYFERYQIACWCCLDEDIVSLFECFKQNGDFRAKSGIHLKKVVKFLNIDLLSDPLMVYWSHIAGDCISELQTDSKNLYEYGLDLALSMYNGYVEAVEYFWKKIKSLPETELSAEQKRNIFIKTAVRATGTCFLRNPEIFEFCISQLSQDWYTEFLKNDLEKNENLSSLVFLRDNCSFHLFRKLFDCCKPAYITEEEYWRQLTLLEMDEYPKYYADEAAKLFMHVWMKEGFDMHRAYVLRKEIADPRYRGTILVPFVKKNYMEPVWAVLDKAILCGVKTFMNSEKASYICYVLKTRGDIDSYNKFLSYKKSTS